MMQQDLERSILDVIDCLTELSCYPDLFHLCLEQLNHLDVEPPAHVVWILSAMKANSETSVDDALLKMKRIQFLLCREVS